MALLALTEATVASLVGHRTVCLVQAADESHRFPS
jgi:hypothetical protein